MLRQAPAGRGRRGCARWRRRTCYHCGFVPGMTSTPAEIVCAHSPDSDDAYMFYALATRKIRSPLVQFRHVLEDIQTLNRKARDGEYELTAISYHAYPFVADRYVLMASGSSIGDGAGGIERQAHRDSGEAHHGVPHAAIAPAGFYRGGSAIRSDSGCGQRKQGRRGAGDP